MAPLRIHTRPGLHPGSGDHGAPISMSEAELARQRGGVP